MSLINDIVANLKESDLEFTDMSETHLKGRGKESGTNFEFEIKICGDIAMFILNTEKLSPDLLEVLAEQLTLGLCLKVGTVQIDKRIFLSGDKKMDVFIVSQWLLILIFNLGDGVSFRSSEMDLGF